MKTEQDLRRIFSYNIRTRRERKGWTQEVLAEKAKVSKNMISDYETSQKFAHAKTLVRLATALETEVYELLKPDDVLPDKSMDRIIKFGEEVREAYEKVENRYLGSNKT